MGLYWGAICHFLFHSFLIALSMSCFLIACGMGVLISWNLFPMFSAPFLAASSAASFPSVPICAFIHAMVHPLVLHFRFSKASAVLRAIVDLKSILSKDLRAACESVKI